MGCGTRSIHARHRANSYLTTTNGGEQAARTGRVSVCFVVLARCTIVIFGLHITNRYAFPFTQMESMEARLRIVGMYD